MSNYPLIRVKGTDTYHPQSTSYSNELTDRICGLFIRDELRDDPENPGKLKRYYRLHSSEPKTPAMAFRMSIRCPKCSDVLRRTTNVNDYHDLGLYECPTCNHQ